MEPFQSFQNTIEGSSEEAGASSERHDLYKNLFLYLEPCFPSISDDSIERLSLAGYAYFRFLLVIDQVVDRSGTEPRNENSGQNLPSVFEEITHGLALHERSIRELAVLFQDRPEFWSEFETIKNVYREAVRAEKSLSGEPGSYTKELFEKIAGGKSAVSRAAVLALCVLSGRNEVREALEKMLIRYHQGLQILDDLDDFRTDIRSGQSTWAISRTDAYLREHVGDPSAIRAERKYKYFFVSNIASSLLREAETYFEEAITLAQKYGLREIQQRFEEKLRRCTRHQWEIERLIDKTRTRVQHSNEPARDPSEANLAVVDEASREAISFLEEKQTEGGLWKDFLTSAGMGTHWVSGYVGYQLAEVNLAPHLTSRLQSRQTMESNTGAYNETMIRDGDSTGFWVGFIYEKTGSISKQAIEEWHPYRNEQGGWRTYLDADALRDRLDLPPVQIVRGWLTAKPCVTAASAMILAKMSSDTDIGIEPSIRRLLSLQEQDPFWISYWWTSPIYATSFALRALSGYVSSSTTDLASINSSIDRASMWLRSIQNDDGSWTAGNHSSPLYTALAVKSLAEIAPLATVSIRAGANWLLQAQRTDGSWPTHRVLRIPATSVTDPSTVEQWRESSFGTNVLVDDHRRVFTTATVINALTTAKRVLADN